MEKAAFAVLAACLAAQGFAAARIRAVYTVPGELNGIVGHVQGAACSTQGVYLSHAGGIYKIGWDGRLVRSCAAPVHLGDVAYADGRLYGALALREPVGGKKGMVRVWDEDLNVVGEHLLPDYIDGCAVIGETIYYGLDLYGPKPHRRCRIGRLSRDGFRDLGAVETDQGGACRYGVQTMATDGARLFCGYYAAGTPPVTCAWFTPDLKACGGTPAFPCAEGFGRIPPSLFPSEHPRFFVVRALGGSSRAWHSATNPPQVRLDFYEWREGQFHDVTERVPPPALQRGDFRASDPFIAVDRKAKRYRMYLAQDEADGGGAGVLVRTSRDLQAWSAAKQALRVPERRACAAVRAPEMHEYKGKSYLFATLALRDGSCGTWIYRADAPEGPFREWSAGPVPPPGWSTRDGTLWVEDGRPYMVFCHEETPARGGRVMAVALTPDLKAAEGRPFELFRAHGAEGPFLYRSHNGSLLMLWSARGEKGACVYVARSEGGRLAGPWGAHARLFDLDGGQGMLFRTVYGQLALCLHQPDRPEGRRRARILFVEDLGDALRIAE